MLVATNKVALSFQSSDAIGMIKNIIRHFELSPVTKEDVLFIILPVAAAAGVIVGTFTFLILTLSNH